MRRKARGDWISAGIQVQPFRYGRWPSCAMVQTNKQRREGKKEKKLQHPRRCGKFSAVGRLFPVRWFRQSETRRVFTDRAEATDYPFTHAVDDVDGYFIWGVADAMHIVSRVAEAGWLACQGLACPLAPSQRAIEAHKESQSAGTGHNSESDAEHEGSIVRAGKGG